MLKEFIEACALLGCDAKMPKVIHPNGEPAHVYGVQPCTGSAIEWKKAEPAPRQHVARDLDTLARLAQEHHDTDNGYPVVAWYSRAGVVLLLDDCTRRDRVTLPLVTTPQFQFLEKLDAARTGFKQAELVLKLRTLFRNGMAKCENLVAVLRQLRFATGRTTDSAVKHGGSSIGTSILAEATGAGILPEFVTLQLPVFVQGLPGHVAEVECALEPDAGTESLWLIPVPGQVEAAAADAEQRLGLVLSEMLVAYQAQDVPVYFGAPN